jgi:hypothetical protein
LTEKDSKIIEDMGGGGLNRELDLQSLFGLLCTVLEFLNNLWGG